MNKNDEYIKVSELQKYPYFKRLSRQAICAEIQRGNLPAIQTVKGGRYWLKESEIEEYLKRISV